MLVKQLAARHAHVFDPYALIGVLENLDDVARRSAHPDVRRFAAVLSNCKKLPMNPRLGDFVTQVLGDEVEKDVAKMMVKVYKPSQQPMRFPPPLLESSYVRPWLYPRGAVSRFQLHRGVFVVGVLDILRVIAQIKEVTDKDTIIDLYV